LADKTLQKQLTDFTEQLTQDRLGCPVSLIAAVKTTNAVAAALEEHNAAVKSREWKLKVSGGNGQCGKAAYNFAKGAIGHHDSPPTNNGTTTDTAQPDLEADNLQVIFSGLSAVPPGHDDKTTLLRGAPTGIQEAVELEADFWAKLWKSNRV